MGTQEVGGQGGRASREAQGQQAARRTYRGSASRSPALSQKPLSSDQCILSLQTLDREAPGDLERPQPITGSCRARSQSCLCLGILGQVPGLQFPALGVGVLTSQVSRAGQRVL